MTQIDARNISWDLGRDITHELLIGNLGGYEKAKSKFRDNGSLHAERLKKALLEYRRQHNIFEVGDKVVSDFYQLDSVFLISHVCNDDEFIYSNKVFSLGSVFTTSDKLKGECRFLFNEIRHATDAEIKAGKRLEVSDAS